MNALTNRNIERTCIIVGTELYVPEGITHIRANALRKRHFTVIHLPSTLIDIDSCAMYECPHLTTVHFDKCTALTSIGSNALGYTPELQSIDLRQCTALTHMGEFVLAYSAVDTVYLPPALTDLGTGALMHTNISTLEIPSTLSLVPNMCCENCLNLSSITVAPSPTPVPLSFGSSCFLWCISLIDFIAPPNTVSFGMGCFMQCLNMRTFEAPHATHVDRNCLDGCSSLIHAVLNPRIIGNYALGNCSSLKHITLGNNVRYIHPDALAYSANVKTVNVNDAHPTLLIGDALRHQTLSDETLEALDEGGFIDQDVGRYH